MSAQWDRATAQTLKEALELIQQAESKVQQVKDMCTDTGLYRRGNDWLGALALVRDSGNREYTKLLDTIDPS